MPWHLWAPGQHRASREDSDRLCPHEMQVHMKKKNITVFLHTHYWFCGEKFIHASQWQKNVCNLYLKSDKNVSC